MIESWEDLDPDNDLPRLNLPKKTENKVAKGSFDSTASVIPADSPLREAHPFFSSQPTIRILPRNSNNQNQNHSPSPKDDKTASQAATVKTIEEREREYAVARAKIFNQAPSHRTESDITTSQTTNTTNSNPVNNNSNSNNNNNFNIYEKKKSLFEENNNSANNQATAKWKSNVNTIVNNNTNNYHQNMSRNNGNVNHGKSLKTQPLNPDGTKGFYPETGKGRGKRNL